MTIPYGLTGNHAIKTLAIMRGVDPQDPKALAAMILGLVARETSAIVAKVQQPSTPSGQAVGA